MNYKELMGVIRGRRSVRHFLAEPVSRDLVEKLLEAARYAPSNHNRQGWFFVVLDDREKIADLAAGTLTAIDALFETQSSTIAREQLDELRRHAGAFAEAPCVVVAMHKKPTAISRHMLAGLAQPELVSGEPISTSMAVENLLLAAHALGLGACVMTAPLVAGEAFKAAADLPPGYEPTCVIAVGHPADCPPEPKRRAVEKIVEFR